MESNLKSRLDDIILELNKHKKSNDESFMYFVQNRLDDSANIYNKELQENLDFLLKKKELTIAKRLLK